MTQACTTRNGLSLRDNYGITVGSGSGPIYQTINNNITLRGRDQSDGHLPSWSPAKDSLPAHHRGTCEWIFDLEEYRVWRTEPECRCLLISAKAGSGKSVLAKAMYESLRAQTKTAFSPFYAKGQQALYVDQAGMLIALLRELFEISPPQGDEFDSASEWKRLMFTERERLPEWPLQKLQTIFMSVLKHQVRTPHIMILDGIDESSMSRASIIKFLDASLKANKHVKFLLLGRHEAMDICPTAFMPAKEIWLRDHTRADLHKVASHEAQIIRNLDHAQRVEKVLVERSEGIFLWIILVMQAFDRYKIHLLPVDKMISFIKDCPQSLNDLYTEMLDRAHSDEEISLREERIAMLSIVLHSKGVVSLSCLRSTLASYHDPSFWEKQSEEIEALYPAENFQRKTTLCSLGLLEVTRFQPLSWEDKSITRSDLFSDGQVSLDLVKVVLIHKSARDFLLARAADRTVARVVDNSLVYEGLMIQSMISFWQNAPSPALRDDFWHDVQWTEADMAQLHSTLGGYPHLGFYEYGSKTFPSLLDGVATTREPHSWQQILTFLQSTGFKTLTRSVVSGMCWAHEGEISVEEFTLDMIPGKKGLWFAQDFSDRPAAFFSALGCGHIVQRLCSPETSAVREDLEQALTMACFSSDTKIFDGLLQTIQALNYDAQAAYRQAAVAAAMATNVDALKALIHGPSDANTGTHLRVGKHSFLTFPIIEAASGYLGDCIRVLQERGADLDVKDGNGDQALQRWANKPGLALDVFRALSAFDVPSSQRLRSRTFGSEDQLTVLDLLLRKRQLLVDTMDDPTAALTEVITSWLDSGADIRQGAPLVEACSMIDHMDLSLCQMLIQRGADPNATNCRGHTALAWACLQDDSEFVQELIRAGACVTTAVPDLGSALHAACWSGNVAAAEILLRNGAQPDMIAQVGIGEHYHYTAGWKDYVRDGLFKISCTALAIARAHVDGERERVFWMLFQEGDLHDYQLIDGGFEQMEAAGPGLQKLLQEYGASTERWEEQVSEVQGYDPAQHPSDISGVEDLLEEMEFAEMEFALAD